MTRSYNSRRGKKSRPGRCWCGGCANRRSRAELRKKEKQKLLKFWGILYSHKRNHRQHDDFIDVQYIFEDGEITGRTWVRIPYKRTTRKETIINDPKVENARQDYRETLGGWC